MLRAKAAIGDEMFVGLLTTVCPKRRYHSRRAATERSEKTERSRV